MDDICAHASRLPRGIYTQRVNKKWKNLKENGKIKKITAGIKQMPATNMMSTNILVTPQYGLICTIRRLICCIYLNPEPLILLYHAKTSTKVHILTQKLAVSGGTQQMRYILRPYVYFCTRKASRLSKNWQEEVERSTSTHYYI